MLVVNILYSPPPDGDDASSTYTDRAVEYLNSINKEVGFVGPLKVNDDDDDPLPWYIEQNNTAIGDNRCISIFLISCSADGSVNRNIRKIMRKIPKDVNVKPNNDALIAI